jgi:hypothetical protein
MAFIVDLAGEAVEAGSVDGGALVAAGDSADVGLPAVDDGEGSSPVGDDAGDGEVTDMVSDLSGKGVSPDVGAGLFFAHPMTKTMASTVMIISNVLMIRTS